MQKLVYITPDRWANESGDQFAARVNQIAHSALACSQDPDPHDDIVPKPCSEPGDALREALREAVEMFVDAFVDYHGHHEPDGCPLGRGGDGCEYCTGRAALALCDETEADRASIQQQKGGE